MQGSKMVVLVPDAETRERLRAVSSAHPVAGLHTSIHIAHDHIDACVRDSRRSLFDGPLAVLTGDEPSALRALTAGADEAFALDSLVLDGASWARLVGRARLKADARHETTQRLGALCELERLCALGRLVSGVADDLSGPLHNALLSLDMLKRELTPLYAGIERVRELASTGQAANVGDLTAIVANARVSESTPLYAHKVLSELTDTCAAIAQLASDLDLRELGLSARHAENDQHERHELIDLRESLDKILRLVRRTADKNTHIERDYAEQLPEVLAPRARVAQVLISLLVNALSSLRSAEREVHRVRICLRADDDVVTVTVSDDGLGLRPDLLQHVFDASAAPGGKQRGRGLELSVARSTMRSLGGDLMVESLGREGTTFVAWLPRPKQRDGRSSGTVPKPCGPELEGPRNERRRAVLVVEPCRHVLSALSRLLCERYEVLLALSGREARELIAGGSRPDAIVAAVHEADSRKFVEWLLTERADLARRLLLTTDVAEPSGELVGLPWLERPIEPAALFRGIEARFVAPLRNVRTLDAVPSRLVKRG